MLASKLYLYYNHFFIIALSIAVSSYPLQLYMFSANQGRTQDFVNKQNCHIWETDNPHVGVPSSVLQTKKSVWIAISYKAHIFPTPNYYWIALFGRSAGMSGCTKYLGEPWDCLNIAEKWCPSTSNGWSL